MTVFGPLTVAWHGEDLPSRPLVVLLHGRGADERGIIGLAEHLPAGPSYAAVRAPIAEGGATHGSPTAESAAPSLSRWPRPWPGSEPGSTTSHPPGPR